MTDQSKIIARYQQMLADAQLTQIVSQVALEESQANLRAAQEEIRLLREAEEEIPVDVVEQDLEP